MDEQAMSDPSYPKMLYKSETMFSDEESLKAGLTPGGAVRNRVVADGAEDAQAKVDGWTESPADFIATDGQQDSVGDDKPRRGRKPKAEDAA